MLLLLFACVLRSRVFVIWNKTKHVSEGELNNMTFYTSVVTLAQMGNGQRKTFYR